MSIKGSLEAAILSLGCSMGLNNKVSGCHNVPPVYHSSLMQLWPYKSIEAEWWHCIDYKSTTLHTHIDICTCTGAHQHTLHLTHVSFIYAMAGGDDSAFFTIAAELNVGHEEKRRRMKVHGGI